MKFTPWKFLLPMLILSLFTLGAAQVMQFQEHSRSVIRSSLVTWTSYNKTAGFVWSPDSGTTWRIYIDTSATGQAGEYKRVDNTADSGRSNPVLVQHDSLGNYLPNGDVTLVFSVKGSATNLDSNGLQMKVYRRWVVPFKSGTGTKRSTPYSYPGKNGSGIVDSVAVSASGGVANVEQQRYGTVSPHGTFWRIRPDRIPATGKTVTDTAKFDSLWVVF